MQILNLIFELATDCTNTVRDPGNPPQVKLLKKKSHSSNLQIIYNVCQEESSENLKMTIVAFYYTISIDQSIQALI